MTTQPSTSTGAASARQATTLRCETRSNLTTLEPVSDTRRRVEGSELLTHADFGDKGDAGSLRLSAALVFLSGRCDKDHAEALAASDWLDG
jgi:hypothetical protein